jgi:hypothetical protein
LKELEGQLKQVDMPLLILHGSEVRPNSYTFEFETIQKTSVAEPHHFYVAPAPGENFDAVPAAPAPAFTLLYCR